MSIFQSTLFCLLLGDRNVKWVISYRMSSHTPTSSVLFFHTSPSRTVIRGQDIETQLSSHLLSLEAALGPLCTPCWAIQLRGWSPNSWNWEVTDKRKILKCIPSSNYLMQNLSPNLGWCILREFLQLTTKNKIYWKPFIKYESFHVFGTWTNETWTVAVKKSYTKAAMMGLAWRRGKALLTIAVFSVLYTECLPDSFHTPVR